MPTDRRWSARYVALLPTMVALAACSRAEREPVEVTNPARAPNLAQSSSALYTTNAGAAYRNECEANGVPLPTRVLDSSWVNHGSIVDPFLSPTLDAQLWSWKQTTGDRGICLALPRWNNANPRQAELLGVICMGTDSSKACFFDNPAGTFFTEGSTPRLSRFKGGDDLIANGQGVCTDCHAGVNPFVIHPEKSAFVALLNNAARASLLRPVSGWHEPLVPASGSPQWPENPGPETRLASIPSTNDCTACHDVPIVSTDLPGYCNVVLDTAVSRSIANGNSANETMPMNSTYASSGFVGTYDQYRETYSNHYDTMLNDWCKKAPPKDVGVVITVPPTNDPTVVSPPRIAEPLYACTRAVRVLSVIPGASVDLEVNGAVAATDVSDGESYVSFELGFDLAAGDTLRARQTMDGTTSDWSQTVTVETYTGSIPAPVIDPLEVTECGRRIGVRSTIPGVLITAFQNGASPTDMWTDSTKKIAIGPGPQPWDAGDVFTARASLCGNVSPMSAPVTARPAPESLPPAKVDPEQPYHGQEFVWGDGIAYGGYEQLFVGAYIGDTCSSPWGRSCSFSFPGSLGRNLIKGDVVKNRPSLYCANGPFGPDTLSPPAKDCSELPPPMVQVPKTGDTSVFVSGTLSGARVRVFDFGGNELGDGAAPEVILDPPAVVPGIPIVVVQQLGSCIGTLGRMVVPQP